MRVLFLANFYPPTHTAGTETYTHNIACELARRGHDVQVVCVGEWQQGKAYDNGVQDSLVDGVPVRRIHLNWRKAPDPNRYLYDNPLTASYLREWVTELRPDVVHLTSCYTLSASVIDVVKEAGIPLVVTLTDFWFICPSLQLLRGDGTLCDGQTDAWTCLACRLHETRLYQWSLHWLPEALRKQMLTAVSQRPFLNQRRGLRGRALDMADRKGILQRQIECADHIVAPSPTLARLMSGVLPDLPMTQQTHGHDLRWTEGLEDERRVSGSLRWGYLGQILPVKGVHVLLDAWRLLPDANRPSLAIWGEVGQQPAYGRRIRKAAAELDGVTLHGRFPRSQLAAVMNQIDVVVVPSLWYENNPLVIQEAFAAGKPVVASALGGMRDFVAHNESGLLFRPNDPADLAAQVNLLTNEPATYERLKSGIPAVRSIEAEVGELERVYVALRTAVVTP